MHSDEFSIGSSMFGRILRRCKRAVGTSQKRQSDFDSFLALTHEHPSDKWNSHRYAEPYFSFFNPLKERTLKLLEIGVGGYQNAETGYSNPNLGGHSLHFLEGVLPKWRDLCHRH
jgi:hypothetical protein